MNYNDQLLENKEFRFFKQLIYNIAVAFCIILIGALIANYFFGYKFYKVLTPSETPYYCVDDVVVVKAQDEYKVGDVIKFQSGTLPTVHRLVFIATSGNTKYYICHGDAVKPFNPAFHAENKKTSLYYNETTGEDYTYEVDVAYIKSIMGESTSFEEFKTKLNDSGGYQTPTLNDIEGKVVQKAVNYGMYIEFIQNHYMLLIAIVAGIWCFSYCIQNEIDINRARRLL